MKIADLEVRDREEDYININPLQTGGRPYADARKAAIAYVDGYSVCDWCGGDLCTLKKPPVEEFLDDVSKFLGMEKSMLTNGCREAKFSILHSITEKGDSVVVDGNKHYSTYVACERNGLNVFDVESQGEPEYTVNPQKYAEVIEAVKKKNGKLPKAAVLTHVDGNYGNVVDACEVSKICKEYEIPLILNTAYSSGRMPVDGKKLGAEYITASCHKSWAAGGGNIGLIATTGENALKIFRHSEKYAIKPLEILGCSTRGSQTMSLMASYPHVKKRVKKWGEEVVKAQNLIKSLEKLGIHQLGETPTKHDLNFLTSEKLYEISKTHKKKNYYLSSELKKRGIMGIKSGLTKNFKISTYGKSQKQLDIVVSAFEDIIEKYC